MAEPEHLDNTDFQPCPQCAQGRPDVIYYSWRAPGANLDIRCPSCGFALPSTGPQTQDVWNSLCPGGFLRHRKTMRRIEEQLRACAQCGRPPIVAMDLHDDDRALDRKQGRYVVYCPRCRQCLHAWNIPDVVAQWQAANPRVSPDTALKHLPTYAKETLHG